MTPEGDAAIARRLANDASGANGPWTSEQRVRMAIAAVAHAVLSLRPEPFAGVPIVTDLPTLRGAVVRATIADGSSELNGERVILALLPDLQRDNDDMPWCAESGEWLGDESLRDVEVLFPGVPS